MPVSFVVFVFKLQNRRKSEPKTDEKSPQKHPQVSRENTPIPIGKRNGLHHIYSKYLNSLAQANCRS